MKSRFRPLTHLEKPPIIYKKTTMTEEDRVDVNVKYSIDKDDKIITISSKDSELEKLAEKSDGHYTKEDLEAVVDTLTGTFSYSVDKKQLTLSEREYGEQMIFTKK